MSLVAEAMKNDLICKLAHFVKCSGGSEQAHEIENEKDLKEVIHKVSEWFQGRTCLFLIDDIWCRNGIPQSVTQMLKGIASHEDSRVAFTTRDRELDCDVRVHFKKKDDQDGHSLLFHTAGLQSQTPPEKGRKAIKSLIQISGGVPIALSALGSRAKDLMENRDGVDTCSVWQVVLEEYEKAKSKFPQSIANTEKDETVLNTLYLSVKMMADGTAEDTTEDLFLAFCVIKKRQQVPVNILCRLWSISETDAAYQITKFDRHSIVEISRVSVGGREADYFVVHDLFLDVSKYLAQSRTDLERNVSLRIINSYASEASTKFQGTDTAERQISSARPSSSLFQSIMRLLRWPDPYARFCQSWIDVPDDGFAHSNVFRLLAIANM